MKKTILFLLTLCVILPTFAQQQGARPRSKTETKTVHSTVLNADRSYNIYLPVSYDASPNKKYPILYLFHGINGTHKDWFERGHLKDVADQLIASGEACEMIIVSIEAGGKTNEVWNGYFDMPGWKYETFFFTELLPQIEKEYRVIGDKAHRAISGLSMGGGGATKYAQWHSDMFSSVYAMSALMALPSQNAIASNDPNDMLSHFNRSVIANNCVEYVKNATDAQKEQLRSIVWYVDCGDDDFLIDPNIDFYRAMKAANIPLQFRMRDGGHTWEYWHSALYFSLPFASRNFGK